jgi:hypothetical protein
VSCSSLQPDVLAGRHRIEDAIPSWLEVKNRHIKDEHCIVPTSARLQELPPVRALVHVALGKIDYVHVLSC